MPPKWKKLIDEGGGDERQMFQDAIQREVRDKVLLIAPGEVASGALWARGPVSHRHELALRELAGVVELAQEASA